MPKRSDDQEHSDKAELSSRGTKWLVNCGKNRAASVRNGLALEHGCESGSGGLCDHENGGASNY